jgi:hypothetical protein
MRLSAFLVGCGMAQKFILGQVAVRVTAAGEPLSLPLD